MKMKCRQKSGEEENKKYMRLSRGIEIQCTWNVNEILSFKKNWENEM